jgi:receptor protein-tyrosine kinase
MQMKTEEGHLDLGQVLTVLRRRRWVIALFTIFVGALSFALSEHQQKQYTATSSVVFQDPGLSQQASGLQATPTSLNQDPAQIMATNVQLLRKQAGVAPATAQAVGHGLTASAVSSAITAAEQGQTNVATVSATYPSPKLAAAVANTFVTKFIASRQAEQRASVRQALNLVQRQIAALTPQELAGTNGQALVDRAESLRILARLQTGGAQLLTPAKVPSSPSSPKVPRNTVLGLLLGLLLGLTIAFILERLDRRMKDVGDLEAAYRVPLLGTVPQSKSYTRPPHLASAADRGESEVFRLLRAYLRYFNVDRELKSLLIASASPGDGKSTIARNLAQAAQETGTRTLLLEADLRRPSMAEHYGIHPEPGLSDVLIGGIELYGAIHSIPIATRVNGATSDVWLDVLVAGHPAPNPAELMESNAMAELLSWAAGEYELMVIDTPPIAVVSDAISLLRRVDGVVLVSQLGKNSRDSAVFLRERLVGVNAPLLGVVANGVKGRAESGYGYRYGYGYGHYRTGAADSDPEYETSVR